YGAEHATRGGHRHYQTYNALICIKGSCHVYSTDGIIEEHFLLNSPSTCLILEPKDWHVMDEFTEDAILLVLSNQNYDRSDYIDEPYIINRNVTSIKNQLQPNKVSHIETLKEVRHDFSINVKKQLIDRYEMVGIYWQTN